MHCGDQRHAGLCLGRRPCTSRRRVKGRSQGTTLSASDLHNARATILNPFYNMEYKIIKKIRQNTAWIEADILGKNLTPNRCNAGEPLSTSAMTSQSLSTSWRHNSNTKNVAASAREYDRNRFEIYGSALEHVSISLCTRAFTWMLDSVYIKGNQMIFFSVKYGVFHCRVYYKITIYSVN